MEDLPLGKERCRHCHTVISGSEAYSLNGHGPFCEACVNDAQHDFDRHPDGLVITRYHGNLSWERKPR